MVQYQVLFEVSLNHKYYLGPFAKDYEIIMTSSLKAMMKSYQLIFKKTAAGFTVLGKSDQSFLLSSSKEAIKFRFGIQMKNRYFENFSKILPQERYMKYIFRNEVYQENKNKESKTQDVILHSGKLLSDDNFNFCLSGSFKPNKIWGSELTISDGNGNYFEGEIDETTQLGQLLSDDYGSFQVNTSVAAEVDEVFYLDPELNKSWGIIEVLLQSSAQTQYEKVIGSHFKINIDARKVFWTYYFVSISDKYFKNIDIFRGKEKVNFSDPEQVILPNGQAATKITSQKAITLSRFYEGPKIYAELGDTAQGSKEAANINKIYLPTPNVQRIKAIVNNGDIRYYSEMYIQNL